MRSLLPYDRAVWPYDSATLLDEDEYPPDQPVHPQTLDGVWLELDNFGLPTWPLQPQRG